MINEVQKLEKKNKDNTDKISEIQKYIAAFKRIHSYGVRYIQAGRSAISEALSTYKAVCQKAFAYARKQK